MCIGPLLDDIWPRSGHDVKVVTHHPKAENIHSKDPGEHFQRSSLPPSQTLSSLSLDVAQLLRLPEMRVVSPRDVIVPEQNSSQRAAISLQNGPKLGELGRNEGAQRWAVKNLGLFGK